MERFTEFIEQWYDCHKRDLPWRNETDAYRIWVSEIILQQTRVQQGLDYYNRFVRRFPTVVDLAAATEDEVLRMWQGLGYYSRARNMHRAARQIVGMGGFPTTYDAIRSLHGVGDYTAAAIASFAYSLSYPVLDGNVFRVLSRYFAVGTPIDTSVGKREFRALAEAMLDRGNPGYYNQAIMDFGALQCVPQSPDCAVCPLNDGCEAFRMGREADFPVKMHRTKVRERFFTYIYIRHGQQIALRKRGKRDIWAGLYEPFMYESDRQLTEQEVLKKVDEDIPCAPEERLVLKRIAPGNRHVLSHQVLWADFYQLEIAGHLNRPTLDGFIWVEEQERAAYAVPRLIVKLFEEADRGNKDVADTTV